MKTMTSWIFPQSMYSQIAFQNHIPALWPVQQYNCLEPARENVMNAHRETHLFFVVVNQPKIQ